MYVERASRVPGAVVWTRVASGGVHRVLPDGCMDLICCDGTLLVAGPDTRAQLTTSVAGARYAAIRLPPGVGPAVFGVPAAVLRDQRVPLADVWPRALTRRATTVVERALSTRAAGVTRLAAAVEEVALARLAARSPDPLAGPIAARLGAGRGVGQVAAEFGLSERHLHRRCLALYGYGAKQLARIQRLGRALDLITAGGAAFAEAAATAGYADQAHLSREVRALAGVPLRELLAGTGQAGTGQTGTGQTGTGQADAGWVSAA